MAEITCYVSTEDAHVTITDGVDSISILIGSLEVTISYAQQASLHDALRPYFDEINQELENGQ